MLFTQSGTHLPLLLFFIAASKWSPTVELDVQSLSSSSSLCCCSAYFLQIKWCVRAHVGVAKRVCVRLQSLSFFLTQKGIYWFKADTRIHDKTYAYKNCCCLKMEPDSKRTSRSEFFFFFSLLLLLLPCLLPGYHVVCYRACGRGQEFRVRLQSLSLSLSLYFFTQGAAYWSKADKCRYYES